MKNLIVFGVLALACLSASAQNTPKELKPGSKASAGVLIKVKMLDKVSSGDAKNGQQLRGVIAETATVNGRQLPAGSPVKASVVSAAKAGMLGSGGEMSLQIDSVADEELLSDVIVIVGEEGEKELPDAAPKKGTEAMIKPDSVLTFKVVPPGMANRTVGEESNVVDAMN